MKKRLWLLFVPILMFSGISGAQKSPSKFIDEQFRQQMKITSQNAWFEISIARRGTMKSLGKWTPRELEAALAYVHLVKAVGKMSLKENDDILLFEAFTGEVDPVAGFATSLRDNTNAIGGVRYSPTFNKRWRSYQLSPQSCRNLKKHVLARWRSKIRQMRAVKP